MLYITVKQYYYSQLEHNVLSRCYWHCHCHLNLVIVIFFFFFFFFFFLMNENLNTNLREAGWEDSALQTVV